MSIEKHFLETVELISSLKSREKEPLLNIFNKIKSLLNNNKINEVRKLEDEIDYLIENISSNKLLKSIDGFFKKLKSKKIKISTKLLDKTDDCPVCCEDISNLKSPLSCGHWIHTECVVLSGNPVCPMCKEKVKLNKKSLTKCKSIGKKMKKEKEEEEEKEIVEELKELGYFTCSDSDCSCHEVEECSCESDCDCSESCDSDEEDDDEFKHLKKLGYFTCSDNDCSCHEVEEDFN